MRPCVTPTITARHAEFGGPRPLICVPLVAPTLVDLEEQAAFAHTLSPDVVEWRADYFDEQAAGPLAAAAHRLRTLLPSEALLFTLRSATEGGVRPLADAERFPLIHHVVASGAVDLVDAELASGPARVTPLIDLARAHGVRVVLSSHHFQATPDAGTLLAAIDAMVALGADIAKVACMPTDPADVLRLLDVTLTARKRHPATGLCTMAMGNLGVVSRATGFLFGSDMSFAAGKATSAPGQIPIHELRALLDSLGRFA